MLVRKLDEKDVDADAGACAAVPRLKMALRDNMATPWVKENGVGDVDMARLAKSIDQIADTYEFKNRPKAEDIFTREFLPPVAQRKL